MADVDWQKFGTAFRARLDVLGYTLPRAEQKWPDTNRAMLSRAINGKTLSAGSYLLLCSMAGLDPYAFHSTGKHLRMTRKSVSERAVTARVKRETEKT